MADRRSISKAPTADIARALLPDRRPAPWIVAPWHDLAWIVAAPALVFLGISLAGLRWSGDQITAFALVFAIGHHLPGMMRAYGDRELFARFRWRFILAPAVLVAGCLYASPDRFAAVALATGIWGWWHYLMQTYGFARIYDGKAGSLAPLTRWLDYAMCVAWFAAPLALTSKGNFIYVNLLARTGMPVISAEALAGLRTVAVAGVLVVTALFAANLVWQTAHGRPPSPIKLALMATTFTYYWYSLATVDNILVSYALFELFHDVQYLTIVWAFNRRRVESGAGVGGLTRFLFRQRGWLVGLYVLCVAGYGLLNHFAKQVSSETVRDALIGVFTASTLLHYYYDGFIWKLRESETRRPLDIVDGAPAGGPAFPRWASHAALWLLLGGPVLALLAHERHSGGATIDHLARVATTLPESPFAQHDLGRALAAEKRYDEAIAAYRRAIALNPNMTEIHYNLAVALTATGDEEAACEAFRHALRLSPGHALSHYHLAVSLHRAARLDEAEWHCRKATARRSPVAAEAHLMLAGLLEQRSRLTEAEQEYRAALRLRPGSADVVNQLGVTLARQDRLDEAAETFRRALKLDPGHREALLNRQRAEEMLATQQGIGP